MAAPVALYRVDAPTLDPPNAPATTNGLRDYDVQALIDRAWTTAASVAEHPRDDHEQLPQLTMSAVRLLITDSNDHGYSRVAELEGY